MKKILYIIIPLLILGILLTAYVTRTCFLVPKTLTIALVGPMKEPEGIEMKRATQLYIDKINDSGGINGNQVKLKIYNDRNDRKEAIKIANDIISNRKILMVLGHYYSSASIAAGRIYRKEGIPAITGSAMAEMVTAKNDWYFRTIANTDIQGSFVAKYMVRTSKEKAACIIYDKGDYGSSLASSFEKAARSLKLEIQKKWGVDPSSKKFDEELRLVASELRAIKNPGIIFVCAVNKDAVRILASFRYPETRQLIVVSDPFSKRNFEKGFTKYPQESARPGYYTDGVYAIIPFMKEIANNLAHQFITEYTGQYGEEPSWIAATYYDAAKIAVKVLTDSEIMGGGHIRGDRKRIRDSLAEISSTENAVKGVTGYLSFDRNGDMNGPMAVGFYSKQKFYPAFTQYLLSTTEQDKKDVLRGILTGDLIQANDVIMSKTKVVYAGVDINEISNLQIKRGTCTVDFYLWFRYQGYVDMSDIVFENAETPVKLGPPILNERKDGVDIRAYHVKATFKSDFAFHDYPFDRQTIKIRLRHRTETRDKLIFMTDVLGMGTVLNRENIGIANLNAVSGWYIKDRIYYQDVLSNVSTLGNPEYFETGNMIHYSQFNIAIDIQKKGFGAILRSFLPTIVILSILYLIFWLPARRNDIRMLLIIGVLLVNAAYHLKLRYDLPVEYTTAMEYTYFLLYILIAFFTFLVTLFISYYHRGKQDRIRKIVKIGKRFYPIVFIGCAIITTLIYQLV